MHQPRDEDLRLLRQRLDELSEQIDAATHRANDPVSLVWSLDHEADRELAALVAASVAYGRVALVRDAGKRIMQPLGSTPMETLLALEPEELREIYEGYVYRMTRGEDVVDMLCGIRQMVTRHGSLREGYLSQKGSTHLERASGFIQELRQGRLRQACARGLKYLLTDPADGSTAKRMHLFFRWMVRPTDAIDPGLWSDDVSAADLIMPLDTHTSRLGRYLGLCSRKATDLKTAIEVTQSLKRLDPKDPLRFDFPLCHLGISKACIHVRSEELCPSCPLEELCLMSRGAM